MTEIDSLQITIESNSKSAAQGIGELAGALENLKKNGAVGVAVKNLKALATELRDFPDNSQAGRALGRVAGALREIKQVGSVKSAADSLSKLGGALRSLDTVKVDSAKITSIANALGVLSNVKAGGINTMMNGLLKIGKATDALNDTAITEFANRVDKLMEKLKPLSERMTTIQGGLRAINSNARSAGRGVREMGDEVDVAALNLSNIIHVIQEAVHWLQQAIQKFSEFMKAAVEWDGIHHQFGNAFGEQADEYYEKIVKTTEALKINTQTFMENSAMATSMLIGFGVGSSDARKMGVGYTELAYDIWAAFNNVYKTLDGAEGAMAAVRSAIAGEVEPIRRAGFTIVDSQLAITAANHGLAYSTATATEAQKSYLRYLTLVDQATQKGIIGTYASEMNTAEGMMRSFQQQLKSLTQAFGSLFIPILVKVMPYVQAFVDLLTEGVYMLAGIFGIEIQKVDFSGYGEGADAIAGVGDAAAGAGDALGSAAKAAKELKNATLGIDELNVISPPSATGGSGGGGGSGSAGGWDSVDVDSLWDDAIFDSVKSKVSDIVQRMKEWLGISDEIDTWAEFFDTRLGNILELTGLIGGAFVTWSVSKKFIDNIATIKKLLEHPTYSITIAAILTITGITMAYQGFEDAIANGLDGFNFAEILGGSLLTTGGVAILGSKLATWISTAFSGSAIDLAITQAGINLGVGTAGAVGATLAAGAAGIILGIPTMFLGIYDACKDGLDWLNGLLIPAGSAAAGAGIGAIIGSLGGPIGAGIGALIGLAVGLVTDGIILITQNWDKIKQFFTTFFTETIPGLWEDFVEWCGGIGKFFAEDIPRFFTETLPEWGNDMAYGLGYAFGTAVRAIVDWWNNDVVPFFTEDIPKFFTETIPQWGENIKTAVGDAFDRATEAISNWWNNDVVPFFKEDIPKFFTEDLPTFFDELPKKFKEIGENIINGIVSGIEESWKSLKKTITGWKDKFLEGFRDAFGIHSPSTVMRDEIGENLVSGIIGGMSLTGIKDRLSSMWSTAKTWWNTQKGTLKAYTPNIGSIKDKLSSAWSNAKTWWNEKKTKLKEYTPSIGSIKDKLSSAWNTAKNWWNNKKTAMKSYTPTIGSIKDKLVSAWKTAKDWWKKNVKLSIPSLSFKVTYTDKNSLGTIKKAIVNALDLPGWPKLSFAANGGMFDMGSLVWAGERGPEIVASAGGGKTGVMNVQQMSDAMYEAVYSAVIAANRANSGSGAQPVNVYLDGRQIYASVKKTEAERGVTLMGNQLGYTY